MSQRRLSSVELDLKTAMIYHCDVLVSDRIVVDDAAIQNFTDWLMCVQVAGDCCFGYLHRLSHVATVAKREPMSRILRHQLLIHHTTLAYLLDWSTNINSLLDADPVMRNIAESASERKLQFNVAMKWVAKWAYKNDGLNKFEPFLRDTGRVGVNNSNVTSFLYGTQRGDVTVLNSSIIFSTYKYSYRNDSLCLVAHRLMPKDYHHHPTPRSAPFCRHFSNTTNFHPLDPCVHTAVFRRRNTVVQCSGFGWPLLHWTNYAKRPAKCIETIMQLPVVLAQRNDPEEGKLSGNCSIYEKWFHKFCLPIMKGDREFDDAESERSSNSTHTHTTRSPAAPNCFLWHIF